MVGRILPAAAVPLLYYHAGVKRIPLYYRRTYCTDWLLRRLSTSPFTDALTERCVGGVRGAAADRTISAHGGIRRGVRAYVR